MSIFEIVYWSGIFIEMAIRAPLRKTWKEGAKTDQRVSKIEKILLGLLSIVVSSQKNGSVPVTGEEINSWL